MKHCNLLACLFLLILAANVFADAPTIIDVNVSPDPVDFGGSISFEANWSDADGNNAKLYACDSTDFDTDSRSCNETEWCSSDYNTSAGFNSCDYTTTDSEIGDNDYYAFICDDVNCSDASSKHEFTVNANPSCSIDSATTPIAVGEDTTITISYSGYGSDPTGYDSIDFGDENASEVSSISCSSGSCTLEAGPYDNAGDYTIQDLDGLIYGSTDANCSGSTSINVDATPPSISVKSLAGDSSSPYWDTSEDYTTTLVISGENNMSCKFDSVDKNYYSLLSSDDCDPSGSDAVCNLGNLDQNNYTYYYACEDELDNNSAVASVSFGLDWSAPTQASGVDATAQSSSSIKITWTASGESDLDYYKIYRDDSEITTVDEGTTEYTNSGLSSSTAYSYKVSAVDDAGNEGAKSSADSATTESGESPTTPSKPSVRSETHPSQDGWYPDEDPRFKWDAVSDADGYSCQINTTSDTTPNTSADDDCNDRDVTYEGRGNGTSYFHVRACNGTTCSDAAHYRVKIDREAPTDAEGLTVSAKSNGTVELNWDDSDDDVSGIDHYVVYRSRNDSFGSGTKIHEFSTDASRYTDDDDDLQDGVKYYYRVVAFDEAGNRGDYSETESATVQKGAAITISLNVPDYTGIGTMNIELTSTGGKMQSMDIKIRKCPGGNCEGQGFISIARNERNTSKITKTYEFDEDDEGEWQVYAAGEDASGNFIDAAEMVTVDIAVPTLNIKAPANNAQVSGDVDLQAEASDSTAGVKEVNFYIKNGNDWQEIGSSNNATGGVYSYLWKSSNHENGSYQLKAEAIDKASNKTEKTIYITIANDAPPVDTTPQDEEYGRESYEYDENKLQEMLGKAGIDQELIEYAEEMISELEPGRELVITKNGDKYYLSLIIRFVNNFEEEGDYQVIEVIPKEFLEDAADIESELEFEVLLADPVIAFTVKDVEAGQEVEIVYEFKDSLTKSQADKLVDAIDEFAAPPIVLDADEELGNSFKEAAAPAGLFGLIGDFSGGLLNLISPETGIISIIIGVIVILVVVAVLLAIIGGGLAVGGKKGNRTTEPEMPGLHGAIRDTDGNAVQRLRKQFGGLFKPEEEEKQGKFAWKEE